jgi:hypothetical protein
MLADIRASLQLLKLGVLFVHCACPHESSLSCVYSRQGISIAFGCRLGGRTLLNRATVAAVQCGTAIDRRRLDYNVVVSGQQYRRVRPFLETLCLLDVTSIRRRAGTGPSGELIDMKLGTSTHSTRPLVAASNDRLVEAAKAS